MIEISKLAFIREWIASFTLAKKQAFWLVAAAFFDALFFFVFALFTTPISDKITYTAQLIAVKLSPLMAKTPGILKHLFGAELSLLTGQIILQILFLFVVVYFVYCIMQGASWWMATRIAGHPWTFKQYFLGFAKINLVWVALYMIYTLLDAVVSTRAYVFNALLPGTVDIGSILLRLILVVLVLAAAFSYPRLRFFDLFKLPIGSTLGCAFIGIVMFFAARFILNFISSYNTTLALFFGLILLFPVIVIIKVYITRVVTYVHTRT